MKKRSFLCLAVQAFIVWAGTAIAQQSKVPPEVWEKAQAEGVVQVLVALDGPTKLPQPWTPETMLGHQQVIAAIQDALLAELAGTNHKVRQRFSNIPGLSLEVGPDALAVLERSPRVLKVEEEQVLQPGLQQSVPLKALYRKAGGHQTAVEIPLLNRYVRLL